MKQLTTIYLQRIKTWLWWKWLRVECWWLKHFGKRYTDIDEIMKDLNED